MVLEIALGQSKKPMSENLHTSGRAGPAAAAAAAAYLQEGAGRALQHSGQHFTFLDFERKTLNAL